MHIPAMANDDRIEVRIELKNTVPMQYEVERRGSLESLCPQGSESLQSFDDALYEMTEMSAEVSHLIAEYHNRLKESMESEMEEEMAESPPGKVGGSSGSMTSKENAMQGAPIIYVSQGQLPYLSVFEYKEVRFFVEKARKYYGTGGNPLIHPSTGLSESIKRLIAQWWHTLY